MYERVGCDSADLRARCDEFRRARDDLFRTHPQSALPPEQRATFRGLQYYAHDPSLRFSAPLEPIAPGDPIEYSLREDGPLRLLRAGRVRITIGGHDVALTVFRMLMYGGGLFLPFKDATAADDTYPGGRYLLDTIKGADLGSDGDRLVIDFNYAYNPSCTYDPRWDCPLAPRENWVQVPIRAGEKRFMPFARR
jgi:hypothetical protein